MILEGTYFENSMLHKETRVYPQYPMITSGLMEGMGAVEGLCADFAGIVSNSNGERLIVACREGDKEILAIANILGRELD